MGVVRRALKCVLPAGVIRKGKYYRRQWIRNAEMRRVVARDPETGMLYERIFGGRVFIKKKDDYRSFQYYDRLCRELYFKNFLPGPDDTVVDVGGGYGHEVLYVQARSPGVRYVSVEAQPSVYECLANTLAPYRPRVTASPLAIADEPALWFSSAHNYEIVSPSGGCVEVPAITWLEFCRRYQIGRIALLKMNIEGGEVALLKSIGDMSLIDRAIIGTHDFVAERRGEYFRTEAFVTNYLRDQGFKVIPFVNMRPRGWIYAQR